VLPKIATPTLVLRGADSIVSTEEGTAALADGLPDRELHEIKDGSHMLLLEHPEEAARSVREFLQAHRLS
jgi:pimeloyl-ACP methyl ester carboxylesterase